MPHIKVMTKTPPPTTKKPVVKLTGTDGNAFAILAKCRAAARKANMGFADWNLIADAMTSGDYDHLLATAMENFDVR